MPAAPAEAIPRSPLGKSRRVALWLSSTLVLLAIAAGIGIAYQTLSLVAQQRQEAIARTGGDPDKGPALLVKYGCVNCHNVPGLQAPTGNVGPDLAGIGKRAYVAGVLANTPQNLMRWIVDPQDVDPKSAMPNTGISPAEARDVAAYLYANP
jgi:cytochrome c1